MKTVQVKIDATKELGKVKPMHAVNNGPIPERSDQTCGNFGDYKAAGIPFARNHDAAFCSTYGGEHTVDVHLIFPDFDADVNDPASYDFTLTDLYNESILAAGTQIYYRLGSKIEHNAKKYGTLVPKDFQKWAEICEHIILHMNEGWADGHHYGITYWEIWNEPDLDPDDSTNKRTWGGTAKQFYELYRVAATHLKKKFPQLKIGGPALAFNTGKWTDDFLAELTKEPRVPLDFFSWHIYGVEPQELVDRAALIREKLDKAGYTEAESILNEWNYIKGWSAEFVYSIEMIHGAKGAAFTAACMAACQNSSIDLLMYYDARPTTFNGLFDLYTYRPLKGYYPFLWFSELYKAGTQIAATSDDGQVYALAAQNAQGKHFVFLVNYADEGAAAKQVTLNGFTPKAALLTDEDHTNEAVAAAETVILRPNAFMLLTD